MNKLNENSTPEEIHAHIDTSLPKEGDFDRWDAASIVDDLVSNPQFNKEHFDKTFSLMITPEGKPRKNAPLQNLMDSSHFSKDHANVLLNALDDDSHKYDEALYSTVFNKHPDLDRSKLHSRIERDIANKELKARDLPYYANIEHDANYLNSLLAKRPGYKQGDNLSPEDQAQNDITHKTDLVYFRNIKKAKHTPQTLSSLVDYAISDKILEHTTNEYLEPGEKDENFQYDFLGKLINERKDLSKDHLNKIFEKAIKSDKKKRSMHRGGPAATIQAIMEHKNVDPALLAKVVKMNPQDMSDNHWESRRIFEEALSNPNLPHETVNSLISEAKNGSEHSIDKVGTLLLNPSLTKDQVTSIHELGFKNAINHPNADTSLHHDFWEKSDKGTDSARILLQSKSTPPEILKELVNHKNKNVAIEALDHPNVDITVVNEGLKRKMRDVQDKARIHPLVAETELKRAFQEGRVKFSSVLNPKNTEAKHFEKLSPEEKAQAYEKFSENLRGSDIDFIQNKSKEDGSKIFKMKAYLATSKDIPEHIRNAHADDIVEAFSKKVPANSSDYGFYGDDVRKHYHEAFKHLLTSGNNKAEEKALEMPGFMKKMGYNFGNDDILKLSPTFINKAFDKIKELNGQTLIDERGIPRPVEGDDILRSMQSIAPHPSLSEDKLEEYLNHPGWGNSSFTTRIGARYKNKTLLDKRYSKLTDDEKRQAFQKYMTPERYEGVVVSLTAPNDMRGQAFDKLDPDTRTNLLYENQVDLASLPDENIKNSVMGAYNHPDANITFTERNANNGMSRSEMYGLKALDPEKISHAEILGAYLDKVKDGGHKVSEETIRKHLNSGFFQKHLPEFEKRAGDFPDLHAKAAVSTAEAIAKKSPQKALELLRNQSEIANQANQYAPLEGTSGKDLFWEKVLNYENKELFKTLVGKEGYIKQTDANGALDFLKDLAKNNKKVKGYLISNKLLSPDAESEVKNSFKNYGEFLLSLDKTQKFNEISSKLTYVSDGGTLKPDELEHIVGEVSPTNLVGNPYSLRGVSDKDLDKAKQRITSLYDQALGHEEKKISALLLKNVFGEWSNGSFTKKAKAEFAEHLVNHILEKQYDSPEAKAEAVERFYSDLSLAGESSSRVLKKLGDYANSTKNLRLLVGIFKQNPDAPKSISSQILKIAAKSNKLDLNQILELSSLYANRQFSVAGMKEMHSNFEKLLAKKLASGEIDEKQANNLKKSYISNVAKVNINTDKDQLSLAILRKYMSDEATAEIASAEAYKYLSSDSLSKEEIKSLYLSLPDENSKFEKSFRSYISLPRDLANDPEIIENSTSGWKLNKLIHSIEVLSSENISILTNRVMLEDGEEQMKAFSAKMGFTDHKAYYFSKIMNTPQTKEEDVNKFLRSMSEQNLANYIDSSGTGDFAETHSHVLVSHMTENLSKILNTPEIANLERGQPEHRNALLKQAGLMAKVLSKANLDADDLLNAKEKISSFRDGKIVALSSLDQAMSDLDEKAPEAYNIGQIISELANSTFSLDSQVAVKMFDTLSKFEKHIGYVKSQGMPSEFFAFEAYKSTLAKTEALTAEAAMSLSSYPVYPFAIAGSNISKEMLEPLDFPKLFNEHGHRMINIAALYFGKMEREALEAHGPNIMNALADYARADATRDGLEFRSALVSGLKFANTFFNYENLSNFTEKVPDQYKPLVVETCIESGAGGEKYLDEQFKIKTSGKTGSQLVYDVVHSSVKFLKSPAISSNTANKVIDSIEDFKKVESTHALNMLAENKYTPPEVIEKIAKIVLDNHKSDYKNFGRGSSSAIALELIKHPGMKYEDVKKIFDMNEADSKVIFRGGARVHPAFLNPKHGSKLLRSLPVNIPEPLQDQIKEDKVVRDISVAGRQAEKLTQVMQAIPAEGITWPEFKRKYPKYENIKEVKDLFISKKSQPVMPEDMVQVIRQADETVKNNSFHVTFADWDGAQRHNRKQTNLVVQLNSSQKIDDEMAKDPKLWSLYQMILKETNGILNQSVGTHPTTPHLISWSRVDVSNKDAWIIEEFQSDAAQKFRKNLRAMIKASPSGLKLNGQDITPSELKGYMAKIESIFENWQKGSMEAVIQNAKAHGIKTVYMHGYGIRSMMSGGQYLNGSYVDYSKDYINPRIKEIYDGNAEKFGFKKCDYTDYPNFEKETLNKTTDKGLPTHCWKLKVS